MQSLRTYTRGAESIPGPHVNMISGDLRARYGLRAAVRMRCQTQVLSDNFYKCYCYGLNVWVPLNSHAEMLTHNVRALGGGVFGR